MYHSKGNEKYIYGLFSNTPPQTGDSDGLVNVGSCGTQVSGFVSPSVSISLIRVSGVGGSCLNLLAHEVVPRFDAATSIEKVSFSSDSNYGSAVGVKDGGRWLGVVAAVRSGTTRDMS